jgi:DNA-binding IclR family transcriptional regulator
VTQVPAATQVLDILRYLSRQPAPVGASAISRDLAIPRSSVYHLLKALTDASFVVHLPEERRFGLGVGAYELATGYTRHEPLQRLARVPLAEVVDRTRHSGHLAVLHGREVVYVIEERAAGRPSLVTDVGVRLPAHLTASGRAMLAELPGPQVRALFPDPAAFVLRHEFGPTSISELNHLLVEVRHRGFAEENGEVTPGHASLAVAVLDHTGHPVAAVAVTFTASEIRPVERTRLVTQIARTAREVGRRIGGSSPHPSDLT